LADSWTAIGAPWALWAIAIAVIAMLIANWWTNRAIYLDPLNGTYPWRDWPDLGGSRRCL